MAIEAPQDYRDFVHTGAGTLAGRYMRRFWQPVYVSRNLTPGAAKPIRVMSEDFTLYRGEAGTPHVVAFRCAHRGTQLSTGWVEGDEIRCRYHGWRYDGSGQCTEVPGDASNFCKTVRIDRYPVEEYLGLIFVYLGEDEPPPLPRYPDYEGGGVVNTDWTSRPCNFFNILENGADPVHFVQSVLFRAFHDRASCPPRHLSNTLRVDSVTQSGMIGTFRPTPAAVLAAVDPLEHLPGVS